MRCCWLAYALYIFSGPFLTLFSVITLERPGLLYFWFVLLATFLCLRSWQCSWIFLFIAFMSELNFSFNWLSSAIERRILKLSTASEMLLSSRLSRLLLLCSPKFFPNSARSWSLEDTLYIISSSKFMIDLCRFRASVFEKADTRTFCYCLKKEVSDSKCATVLLSLFSTLRRFEPWAALRWKDFSACRLVCRLNELFILWAVL